PTSRGPPPPRRWASAPRFRSRPASRRAPRAGAQGSLDVVEEDLDHADDAGAPVLVADIEIEAGDTAVLAARHAGRDPRRVGDRVTQVDGVDEPDPFEPVERDD